MPVPKMTPAEEQSVTRVIESLAAKQCQRFPFLNFNDVVQEGWRHFLNAAHTHWDPIESPKRCKISTWAWRVVCNGISSYGQKEHTMTTQLAGEVHFEDESEADALDPYAHIPSMESTSQENVSYSDTLYHINGMLSPYAKKMLQLLLEDPQLRLTELAHTLGLTRKDTERIRFEIKVVSQIVL